MKVRSFAILVLIVGLALLLTRGGAAQVLDASAGLVAADTETRFTRHGEVIRETVVVPFEYGIVGVTTSRPYTGTVGVSVSGVGQASGTHWSDAFYIYTDPSGQPVTPWHPTEFYNWTLWVNEGPSDDFVQPIPAYNAAHEYRFKMNAPGGPLTFAVGDTYTADNTGAYTVTITDYASLPYAAYLPLLARNFLEPVRVPVLRLAYYPPDPANPDYLDPAETGWSNHKIADMQTATQGMVEAGLALISESTRYHGYEDPSAPVYLEYYVLDTQDFLYPMPRGYHLGGTEYRPNYGQILRDLSICDYVDVHGVREVWIYGYHSDFIVPDESKMSSKYGDVSNAAPKDEYIPEEYRLPRCTNSYVMYNFTYQPGGAQAIGNTIHNRMHQMENVVFFAEDLGYPANNLNVIGSLFWDDFSVYGDRASLPGYRPSCGNTHSPPNTTDEYAYSSTEYRENNCETWHPDDSLTTYINANCEQWGCTDVGFYKWFMQSVPGYDNGIVYEGRRMRNWWEAMYDFNRFIDAGRSLYIDSPE